MSEALVAKAISKSFHEAESELKVLDNLEIVVQQGERVAILGRSGSGKSTLLHILAALMDADSGDVLIDGESILQASPRRRAQIRGRSMGFIYQFHHLLSDFSALENVAMPLLIRGEQRKESLRRAEAMLHQVGLGDRLAHRPFQLSGGERQRVAVVRSLVTHPTLVLADEPSGNLDTTNAQQVLELIQDLSIKSGTAFVLVTHDESLALAMDRQLILADGYLHDYP